MTTSLSYPVLIWAMRDILRRPFETLLLGTALAAVAVIIGIPLLFTQALNRTAASFLENSPSLVVRRVSAGGWVPIPIEEAMEAAGKVRGIVSSRPRLWGVVNGPQGPVTIVAISAPGGGHVEVTDLPRMPNPGEAVAGPGFPATRDADKEISVLPLAGQIERPVRLVHTLPRQTGIMAHDVVFLHPEDAGPLLGLAPGDASDLAVEVFHDEEAEALRPDLAAAFPWPVRITSRNESIRRFAGSAGQRSGLLMASLAPAIAALCLIAGVTVRERLGRRMEIGLYKAMGWSVADILQWQAYRILITGLPAVVIGCGVAFWTVFWPGITWPGRLFFGWPQQAPAIYLDPQGMGGTILATGMAVLAPYLTAGILPALKSAAEDPDRFLEDGGSS